MRHDVRLVCGLVAIAACSSAPARGPELQITGETVKVKRGEALPAKSAIFDGTTVRLRAAQGETLGVIVWRRDDTPVEIALTFDEPGVAVTTYDVADVPVTRPSTRMYGPSRGAGAYPDRLVASSTVGRAALLDVEVMGYARTVEGTLTVGAQTFDVSLRVADAELDAGPQRVWAYYNPKVVGDDAAFAETAARYGVAASPDLGVEDFATYRDALSSLPYVPVLLPDEPAARATAVRQWIDLLAADGRGQLPFAIPIDEPRDDATRGKVRALADEVRAVDGAAGKFLFAVTDVPRDVYGDAVDVFISPIDLKRERDTRPTRWTYNGTPPFAGSMIVDTDGTAMRTWGWISWRWQIPLWYVWDAAYWTDRHNAKTVPDFAKDATTFDDGEDHGALDGLLIYPDGSASLRLAALRRGLQDRLLLEQVEACAGRPSAEAIAARLVPTALGDAGKPGDSRPGSWPTDEAPWEAARIALLDRLEQCATNR